jgi:hypothetical protein
MLCLIRQLHYRERYAVNVTNCNARKLLCTYNNNNYVIEADYMKYEHLEDYYTNEEKFLWNLNLIATEKKYKHTGHSIEANNLIILKLLIYMFKTLRL